MYRQHQPGAISYGGTLGKWLSLHALSVPIVSHVIKKQGVKIIVLRLVILGEVGDRSVSIVNKMILLLKRVEVTIRILIIYFNRLKEERVI